MDTKISSCPSFIVSLARTFTFIVIALSQPNAHASADMARVPAAITQHYLDGSEATLACPFGSRTEFSKPCTFEVRDKGALSRYQFDPLDIGYSFVFQEFWVFGSIANADLQLSLAVQCLDSDLSLLPTDSESESSDCKLIFGVVGGKFVAQYVEITAELNGKLVLRQRELGDK